MKLVFKGLVEFGDPCRVGLEDLSGSVHIGGRDVVSEVEDAGFKGKVSVGVLDERFDGDLFVETGWGYSEYTPMESDVLRVGDRSLIGILSDHEGKEVTLVVSDGPVNLLDLDSED